jgi:energy-coupling factor transporter ATP-binding protein EcfA2
MTASVVIQDLEWKYEHTTEFALKGVSLEIEENSFLGIVGANESGKTTLISTINGLIPHAHNGIYRGNVQVLGKNVQKLDSLQLASMVGFVFADPEAQFTAMTVAEELSFGLENLGLKTDEIGQRLERAAELTMIGDLLDKSPYDISGGQKQRVAIACVLAMNPPIIIMDEPTSMIDPLGKQLIFDILRRLKEAGEHTLIVVEHNVEQLAPLSDRMLLMHDGQIARIAETRAFFAQPELLSEHGVPAPEVTEFDQWLRQEQYLDGQAPVALDLQGAITATELALQHTGSHSG